MSRDKRCRPVVAIAALFGLLLVGSAPAAAGSGAPARLQLGPNVIRTNEGPTGYEVTFRYDAPDDVTSVQIRGEWQFSDPSVIVDLTSPEGKWPWDWEPGDVLAPLPAGWLTAEMTKGSDGIWTWTTPLPSGTHSYHYLHECASPTGAGCAAILDPANPGWTSQLSPTGAQTLSQVYVPSHPRFPTYDNDYQAPTRKVNTGTLEHVGYVSPTSTNPVGEHYLAVYLPAGYDPNRTTPYPTLYLSHGFGGNEGDWSTQGAAGYILENALSDRDALPMVIVMTNFNGLPGGSAGYAADVINNVIPFVESNYNVSTLAADRAFGGLSFGGGYGLAILYDFTPTFEYYGLWSAFVFGPGIPNATQIENMRGLEGAIQMGAGLQDFLANIGSNSIARAQFLKSAGIDVVETNLNGMHTWDPWRYLLNDFIRNVAFQSTTTTVVADSSGPHATLAAHVAPLGTAVAAPTGKVEFYRDGAYLGSAPLGRDGTARPNASVRGPVDGVEARYVGDTLFNASTSG